MIALDGWIEIPPDDEDRIAPLLAEHVALTRAEPGCLGFSVTRHPAEPGRFDVSERFVDRAAFEAHQRRSAASPWGEATRHLRRYYRLAERPA